TTGNTALAWSLVFGTLAGLFALVAIYHLLVLPRPAADHAAPSAGNIASDYFGTFAAFFRKPGIGLAIAFMLLYRLGEAQLVKLATPFLLDPREAGGLGLTTEQVGIYYGTIGVIALTLGGLA